MFDLIAIESFTVHVCVIVTVKLLKVSVIDHSVAVSVTKCYYQSVTESFVTESFVTRCYRSIYVCVYVKEVWILNKLLTC